MGLKFSKAKRIFAYKQTLKRSTDDEEASEIISLDVGSQKVYSEQQSTTTTKKKTIKVLKLRVQNICCGKEATLIKQNLDGVPGIKSVTVNVVGRLAHVTYNESLITANIIIVRLNALHLGISLMESGNSSEKRENKKWKIRLFLRALNLFILTALFIAVIVCKFVRREWTKWVSIPLLVIGGLPMLWKACLDIKRKVLANINLLMLIAVIGAILIKEYLDGCIIVYVFIVAELLECLCRYKVEKNIAALMLKIPKVAVLSETNETVPIEQVPMGTLILVCAGEQIPLDGDVVKGKAAVDESSITGEAFPVSKMPESMVFSGTIIQTGYLKIRTTCDYQSSTISKVSQLTQEAQSKASHTEEMMNRFAKYYTPLIMATSLLLFLVPFILNKVDESKLSDETLKAWSLRALTVLVVACPCSIIMATPIPMVCGITNAAKNGALIKGAIFLERLASVRVIAFDKTATLTEGRFQVIEERHSGSTAHEDVVVMAAALESRSSHPLASAIVNRYTGCITDKIDVDGTQIGLPEVTKFKNESGLGLSGVVNDISVAVGNLQLMESHHVEMSEETMDCLRDWSNEGYTVVFVALDKKLELIYGLADKCRDSAPSVISELSRMDIETIMLTGDSEGPAKMIMKKVGLASCEWSMKPREKFEWVAKKQEERRKRHKGIAMIGDGVNDSPSLAAADVGIAIGPSATALAVESAGVSLMTDNLMKIAYLLVLGKYCRRVVLQNIIGGVLIKVVFVVVALAGKSLLWLAVLSDALGLLFVMVNGLRPLYFKTVRSSEELGAANSVAVDILTDEVQMTKYKSVV